MKYVYIAAPLCNEAEKEFNLKVYNKLNDIGIKCYLPQLHGGVLSDFVKMGFNENEIRNKLFNIDINKLDECNSLLIVLDGRTIDEGACIELGYMFCKGKSCIGFKTDSRSSIRGNNNLMIDGCLERIFTNWDDLINYYKGIKNE